MALLSAYWIEILFTVVLLLSVVTKNKAMVISTAVVLVLRLLHSQKILSLLSDKSMNWGIIIITIGFLAPIALGKYELYQLKDVFLSFEGIISILCGIAVSIFGMKGIEIGPSSIYITMGIICGTIVGVTFFKGSAVGPLIGSGMAVVVISFIRMFGNVLH